MTVFIVLLRGINVGGHNKLPMQALRRTLETLGAKDVSTYIQSGNAVFQTAETAAAFEKKIGAAIEADVGFKPDVFIIDFAAYCGILKNNPFAGACNDPSKLLVTFFKSAVDRKKMKELAEFLAGGERIEAKGAALYFDAPNGVGRSKAAERLGRVFPGGTMRNWRTCLKLEEMAAALAGPGKG